MKDLSAIMHRHIVTVSQGDMVIMEGERCGGIYKLKEGSSRWSSNDDLEKELIARWAFKEECDET